MDNNYHGEIIDTHMHLWDLKNNYPWLSTPVPEFEQLIGNYDQLRQNFLPNHYKTLISKHKISQSIHVQAFGFPDNPVAETRWLQQQADQHGFPQGIVAFANLADPQVGKILEQHAQFPNIRGIRMPLNYHETSYRRMADRADYLTDPQWQAGFSLLEQHSLSFDVQIYTHQLDEVLALAEKFPNTTLIIEHFAWPTDLSSQGFDLWQEKITKITALPNLFMKLSGIGCVFQHLEIPQIKNYIKTAVNMLGADRCMFGSNCPPDTLFHDFDTLMSIYQHALADFSAAEQHKIFYSNAKKIYRL